MPQEPERDQPATPAPRCLQLAFLVVVVLPLTALTVLLAQLSASG